MTHRRALITAPLHSACGVLPEIGPRSLSSVVLSVWVVLIIGIFALPDLKAQAQVRLGNLDGLQEKDKNDKWTDEIERTLKDTLIQKEQSVFIPTPREILRPLIRADRAIQERDMSRAVSLIGEVLSDSTSEDYLVPVVGVEGVSSSLRLRAQQMLGALPRKDRQLYRLRYGVQAKQMLEKAIAENDFVAVSQVMQRFFFTDAGFDAAMLLGHYHLDEGRPIAAANCFQRITNSAEGRAVHDPAASVLLAICWMLGDSPERSTNALIELKKSTTESSIEFMGQPIQLFDTPEQANPWLRKLIGDSPLRNIEMVNQWVMAGGNPQRNARSGTGFPLINPRWSTLTMNDPDLEQAIKKRQQDLIFLESAPIPAVQPLAIGDTIVMRTFDRMIGVNFQTGKRVWVFPPWDFTKTFDSPPENIKTNALTSTPLTERMWMDSVYGQASSDGTRIFVVPNPGFSQLASRRGTSTVEPLLQRSNSELMAIDIEREGAFLWEVGGATGADEPKLAKTFFLGAPLPIGGELFAVCRRDTEIILAVLDSETGKLKWEQQLGTTETSLKLESDRHRRLAGATPSFADGVLVCSTGTGALVGVDLSTRSLLWGYQYTSPGRKEVQPISPGRHSNADPLSGLWRDSSITIADGKVLFTPVDSQDLICVDLQSGFPGWKLAGERSAKSRRRDSLFVACVENGAIILVGETNIRAIDLKTGASIWQTLLGNFGKPSGRGYTNRGNYFFPTTSAHVVQIELATGKITQSVRTNGVLGNLVCHRGDVISHGADRLVTFPQDEPNRKLLELAEADGIVSPEILAIKAQLLIQEGDVQSALETIESAYAQRPTPAYQRLMLDWTLEILDKDADKGLAIAQKHHDLLVANRKYVYLAARINGMIRIENFDAAIDELFSLLSPIDQLQKLRTEFVDIPASHHDELRRSRFAEANDSKQNHRESRIAIRLDRWIASRISLIHQRGTTAQKSSITDRLNQMINSMSTRPGLDRHNLVASLPIDLIDIQVRSEMLEVLVSEREFLRAEQILQTFDNEAEESFLANGLILLAQKLLLENHGQSVRQVAQRIESRFANKPVFESLTGIEYANQLRDKIQKRAAIGSSAQAWNFNAVRTRQESTKDPNNLASSKLQIINIDSDEYLKFQYRFFVQTGEVLILDQNGKQLHKFLGRLESELAQTSYGSYTTGQISINKNLALINIGRDIIAFDWNRLNTNQDPLLWHKSLPGGTRGQPFRSISSTWGEVNLTAQSNQYAYRVHVSPPDFQSICYIDGTQLIALDPLTGERIWQRPNILPMSVLMGDQNHVLVWNATKRFASFFSPSTGSLLFKTRLPDEAGSVWQAYGTRLLVSTLRPSKDQGNIKPKLPADRDSDPTGKPKKPTIKMAKSLGLYDLLGEKMIWEKEYPAATADRRTKLTVGCRVQQDRIIVLQPGKDLQFLDVQTGQVLFECPIKLDQRDRSLINGIGVTVKRGKYLVHIKRGECRSRDKPADFIEYIYINYTEPTWYGTLVCVDKATGKDLWKDHVRFDHLQIGQGLPYDSPIYVFLRRINFNRGDRQSFAQVLAIDLETGNQVVNLLANEMSGYQATYEFSLDSKNRQMELSYNNNRVIFDFVIEDDLPPAPVANFRRLSTLPKFDSAADIGIDQPLISALQKKMLQKALEAQKQLEQKRADEKRRLEAERRSSN